MNKWLAALALIASVESTAQTAFETASKKYKTPTDLYTSTQFMFRGNTSSLVTSNIRVRKNDFVYVEITGKVKVGSFVGMADGAGALGSMPVLESYNKYKGHRHGCIMVILNNKIESCKRILDDLGSKYDIIGIAPDYGIEYVPGYYFIADEEGYLKFDINDVDPGNNSGDFSIGVIVMSYSAHLSRNIFNKCPEKEPDDEKDCFGNNWVKESPKSWYYHGVNDSYRGGTSNPGCQCVYEYVGDDLVASGDHKGSFDIGYWHFKGDITKPRANYFHLILDVIPHDLYVARFGEPNYLFQQKVSCKQN